MKLLMLILTVLAFEAKAEIDDAKGLKKLKKAKTDHYEFFETIKLSPSVVFLQAKAQDSKTTDLYFGYIIDVETKLCFATFGKKEATTLYKMDSGSSVMGIGGGLTSVPCDAVIKGNPAIKFLFKK